MHGTLDSVRDLVASLKHAACQDVEVVVFPPAVFIPEVVLGLQDTKIKVGAQNTHSQSSGAYTGEISATMFAQFGCNFALAGHSERRHPERESDLEVAQKCASILAARLTPILCVGETMAERQRGEAEIVVERQIETVAKVVDTDKLRYIIIAYEPVWAIGTGQAASATEANSMHSFIRQMLSRRLAVPDAKAIRLLYGGSVNEDNARSLFEQPDIDGALVGGASLNGTKFLNILSSMSTTKQQEGARAIP